MRILFANDAPLIKYGLAEGLKKNGHDVEVIGLWKKLVQEQEDVLTECIERFEPDFTIIEGHPVGINLPIFFGTLERYRIPLVYWAIEDPILFDSFSRVYASHSILTFTTVEECLPGYNDQGIRAALLRFGCNPDFHKQVEPVEEFRHDVVLVASNYDNRYCQAESMVKPLVDNGYDIMVWGHWWDDQKRPTRIPNRYYGGLLAYEDLSAVYSSAKIVLGVHCVDTSRTQTSMRTYEVLGCRAFYLTYYTPSHEYLFENGRHLVWSRSPSETLELVDHYLSDDEARRSIADDGQRLVYQRDTYRIRAERMICLVSEII